MDCCAWLSVEVYRGKGKRLRGGARMLCERHGWIGSRPLPLMVLVMIKKKEAEFLVDEGIADKPSVMDSCG